MAKRRITLIGMSIITCLFCLYSALFIYKTSFIIGDTRYFTLFDDAMISMRYAKNLAEGYGLVWNPGGSRVEGFTNPLWVGIMALVHFLPLPAPQISLVIQILGAILLLINLFVSKQIADHISDHSTFVALASTTFIAFYLPLNNWGLQGMEVSLATLLLSLAVLLALKSLQSGIFSPTLLALLTILTTIRLDLLIPGVVITGILFISQPDQRRKHVLSGLIILAAIFTQTAFRHEYYGSLLPNTYYLKMVGYPLLLRITRGIYVSADFILKLNWLCFIVPFAILAVRKNPTHLLLVLLFISQILYSTYVGGDAWEWWGGSNRYIAIVMPIFFILFASGLATVRQLIQTHFPQLNPTINQIIAGVLILGSLVNFNATRGAESWGEWLLILPPMHVAENRRHLDHALLIQQITDEQARVAVVSAGTLPYFMNRYAIDMLGKSDFEIGHATMRTRPDDDIERFTYFYPGHLKWDYAYSIGTLKPDIVAELWKIPSEAEPFLRNDYEEVTLFDQHMYLRKDSPHIRWDLIRANL